MDVLVQGALSSPGHPHVVPVSNLRCLLFLVQDLLSPGSQAEKGSFFGFEGAFKGEKRQGAAKGMDVCQLQPYFFSQSYIRL